MINEQCFRIKKNGKPYSCCYCTKPELIENYDEAIADITQAWECHHKLETHFSDGSERPRNAQLSKEELIALGVYYNRPTEELIFLTVKEHIKLHHKEKCRSEKTRGKISEAMKSHITSENTRRKISDAMKGKKRGPRSEEWSRKISEARKGKHWKLVDGKRIWY